MRKLWVQMGCFLTGYSYQYIKNCSESSTKKVLRYTSAMLIIGTLWAFIGYTFSARYLKADPLMAFFGSVIMVFIVVQIERQVILTNAGNRGPLLFRGVIAIGMAVIGSIIIDQIIFKDDIEQEKVFLMDEKVRKVFPAKASELRRQIGEIDSTILQKEMDRKILVDDISRNPTVPIYSRQVTRGMQADSTTSEVTIRTSSQIQNPKMVLIQPLDEQIEGLRIQKLRKDSMLLVLRPAVEAELNSHIGFLDELELMFSIFRRSTVALFVWGIWFIILLGMELFILVSKLKEPETDYDRMVAQQMELHIRRIELLGKQ